MRFIFYGTGHLNITTLVKGTINLLVLNGCQAYFNSLIILEYKVLHILMLQCWQPYFKY